MPTAHTMRRATDARNPDDAAPRIVITLDEASLDALADRVAERLRLERPAPRRWLVGPQTPKGELPTGHTTRELYDARRRGVLVADLTPGGLVITEEALRAYEGQRRRRNAKPANDVEPTVERTLARAGVALTRRGAR